MPRATEKAMKTPRTVSVAARERRWTQVIISAMTMAHTSIAHQGCARPATTADAQTGEGGVAEGVREEHHAQPDDLGADEREKRRGESTASRARRMKP